MPSSRSATHRAGHSSNRSAASTAETGTSSVLEARAWRAPVTSPISLGAGISAAAARNSSMDPNGSAVPCVNTVGTLMSGRCSVLLDRNAVLFSDRLAGRPSELPLKQATLELMTTPEQPGHTAQQLEAANDAAREAVAKTPNTTDPLLAPHYPATKGQNLRGFGWDIDTPLSTPRGMVFPIGSFGHTGFTGTTLWMDPGSDTYVVLLTNSIHLRGSPPISNLRGDVATAAARALHL